MDGLQAAYRYAASSQDMRAALGWDADVECFVEPCGQGEHHANYLLHAAGSDERFVLRVNHTSQIGLQNQVLYEASVLALLAPSARTPRVYFADDSRTMIDRGVLVIEYCQGRMLDYERPSDLHEAAACLADIHAIDPHAPDGSQGELPVMLERPGLPAPAMMKPREPLRLLFEEDRALCARYRRWAGADARTVRNLDRFEAACAQIVEHEGVAPSHTCVVNTECIAAHFLISDDGSASRIIDWEKPVLGEAAQDVAYFLAPTTTFWDSDFIFTDEQRNAFITDYVQCSSSWLDAETFRRRYDAYLPLICLRGISWCAVAQMEYSSPERTLKHEKTARKIEAYLAQGYLDRIWDEHVR